MQTMDRNTVKDTVLELYGQGRSPKQIAAALHIPVQTVYELTQDISKGVLDDKCVEH